MRLRIRLHHPLEALVRIVLVDPIKHLNRDHTSV